jgi:uncharacterized membrane protein YkvA (DUF1232 family)
MLDDDAPAKHRLAVLGSFLYLLWPGDMMFDYFMGPLGLTDDLAVLWGLVMFLGSENLKPYRHVARRWLRGEIDELEMPAGFHAKR